MSHATKTESNRGDGKQQHPCTDTLWPPPGPTNALPPAAYVLPIDQVPKVGWKKSGTAQVVTSSNFPVLAGMNVTSFIVELFAESMRIPHWHSQSEIGYVQSGAIEVYLWRAPKEAAVFLVRAGSLWFIPQGALHSLNNVGTSNAVLIIGFDGDQPTDFDLPVAFNGLPQGLRQAYTRTTTSCANAGSRHSQLSRYAGPLFDPLTGFNPATRPTASPVSEFAFNLDTAAPLFASKRKGTVTWAVQGNWPILAQGRMAFIRTTLRPGVSRDAIWWPDSPVLYVVAKGSATFVLVFSGWQPVQQAVKHHDMILVPTGVMHTFANDNNDDDDLEVVGFFAKSNPLPEVSLGAATNFFPRDIANAGLVYWGNKTPSTCPALRDTKPLAHLRDFKSSPYLLLDNVRRVKKKHEPHSPACLLRVP